jgi:FixJ family two-component response regulator
MAGGVRLRKLMAAPAQIEAHPLRVLIADDQAHIGEALRLLLRNEGFQPHVRFSPVEVLRAMERARYDAVLMDLNYARDTTSGEEGLALVAQLRDLDRTLPIVVMTAWGSVPLAVEAMRRGARDFILKPWKNSEPTGLRKRLMRRARSSAKSGSPPRWGNSAPGLRRHGSRKSWLA